MMEPEGLGLWVHPYPGFMVINSLMTTELFTWPSCYWFYLVPDINPLQISHWIVHTDELKWKEREMYWKENVKEVLLGCCTIYMRHKDFEYDYFESQIS